jgi:surface antigen
MSRLLVLAVVLSLVGCQASNQDAGAIIGGITGGLLGNQIGKGSGRVVATGVGVMLGAAIGQEVGRQLDEADRIKMSQAMNNAGNARINDTIYWNNSESGNSGSYTAIRDGYHSTGQYCREFRQEINVGGRTEQGYGTACRQPDGSWKITQ